MAPTTVQHRESIPSSYIYPDAINLQQNIKSDQEQSCHSTAVTLERTAQGEYNNSHFRISSTRQHFNMTALPGTEQSYELVLHDEDHDTDDDDIPKPTRKIPLLWRAGLLIKIHPKAFFMTILMTAIVLYSLFTWPFWKSERIVRPDSVELGFQVRPEISHYWGQYSPYYSVLTDISLDVPHTCETTFVQVLSRHGARDPTRKMTIMYAALIDELHSTVTAFSGKYAFLKDYEYTLGFDQLSEFGKQQMINSGTKFYERYKNLALHYTPFVRASGQERVVDSAHLFTQGYHDACQQDSQDPKLNCNQQPFPYVEISEEPGSHNPLDHGLCKAFEDEHETGKTKEGQIAWRNIFAPPITARLNRDLPGAAFEDDDTVMLMDLCPFETVARTDGNLAPFCDLFTEQEWKQYDYYQTVGKYYAYASYYNLGPTQGVGFTNELIARLTAQPVQDRTSVDHVLDSNPETFPLGKEYRIYADFSHDNDMISILAAMSLFNDTAPLTNTSMSSASDVNGFSTSRLVPFAARIYFEKLVCTRPDNSKDEEYIRIIVNDRVQCMRSCKPDEFGRCLLSDFLESLTFAKGGGRWDDCD